jgi:hypothetical protein
VHSHVQRLESKNLQQWRQVTSPEALYLVGEIMPFLVLRLRPWTRMGILEKAGGIKNVQKPMLLSWTSTVLTIRVMSKNSSARWGCIRSGSSCIAKRRTSNKTKPGNVETCTQNMLNVVQSSAHESYVTACENVLFVRYKAPECL